MHGVGFEPTRLSPADLKSAPLDHSGIRAQIMLLTVYISLEVIIDYDLLEVNTILLSTFNYLNNHFICCMLTKSSRPDSNWGWRIQSPQ
jgi:hypothetical protein